jgi:hypothetical protein
LEMPETLGERKKVLSTFSFKMLNLRDERSPIYDCLYRHRLHAFFNHPTCVLSISTISVLRNKISSILLCRYSLTFLNFCCHNISELNSKITLRKKPCFVSHLWVFE